MGLVNLLGALGLDSTLQAIRDKFGTLHTQTPDNTDAGAPVRVIGEQVDQCSFADVGSGLITTDMVQRKLGTGVGVSQAGGNLLITSGTSANQEFLARSVMSWQGSWRQKVKTILSQRIANNNFAVIRADKIGEDLAYTINSATSITVTKVAHGFTAANVGQFMFVGAINGAAGVPGRYAIASIPSVDTINFTVAGWPASGSGTLDLFGWNHVKLLYNGTTATSAFFDAQRKGWASGDTTLTITSPASPGHVAVIQNDIRTLLVGDMVTASSATTLVTARGSRVEGLPDDNTDTYLYLWSYNGTTNPATTTTWTVGFWSVERFAKTPVYIAGMMANGGQQPLAVSLPGTQAVSFTQPALVAGTAAIGDVGGQYRANATGAASIRHLVSAASTNATNVKSTAGRLVGWSIINTNASWRYVKLHNTAGTPTAGAAVVATIAVPPNGVNNQPLGFSGIGFATGIAFTTVTGAADTDANAVGANDLIIDLFYA